VENEEKKEVGKGMAKRDSLMVPPSVLVGKPALEKEIISEDEEKS
jgi:hypothetical protein